jgi:DNA polymerase-3 subunit epsilon
MIGLVLDFETSGLLLHPKAKLEKQPRAIEIGAVLFNDAGELLEEFERIVDPCRPIEAIITKITGLTNEDLAGKPKFSEIIPELAALFRKADVLIAHNLPFDSGILEVELAHAGQTDFPWPQINLCTAQSWQEQWGRRPKLLELYEHVIGRPLLQTHRALDDVKALVEICVASEALNDMKGIS